MDFTKVQSIGNDFILIEATNEEINWADLANKMCQRHYGVGADGLLLLLSSNKADFRMRIFNSDGSEAETCGNGLRCLANYVYSRSLSNSLNFTIETIAGIHEVVIQINNGVTKIRIGMGVPEFSATRIPLSIEPDIKYLKCGMIANYPLAIEDTTLDLSFVSMGNPHSVCFVENNVEEFHLTEYGPLVEKNHLFPQQTNFEIAQIIDKTNLEMRVWERGVGETLACGSGACAVTVASWILGYTTSTVNIKLPGGELTAEWNGPGEDIYLTGKAEIVFFGNWPN